MKSVFESELPVNKSNKKSLPDDSKHELLYLNNTDAKVAEARGRLTHLRVSWRHSSVSVGRPSQKCYNKQFKMLWKSYLNELPNAGSFSGSGLESESFCRFYTMTVTGRPMEIFEKMKNQRETERRTTLVYRRGKI